MLYSSGTTGLPKAIVQGHGGILLEHLKMLHLHVDLQSEDRLFWFTTTGWMMWNFVVGGLLTDASIVLYDGNPGHPDLGALWNLAEEAGVTCFGTSAGYIAACSKGGVEPRAGRALSRLTVGRVDGVAALAGGVRLGVRRARARHVALLDVRRHGRLHAFVGGVPTLPVYRGELQARSLGAKVEAWTAEGVARRQRGR